MIIGFIQAVAMVGADDVWFSGALREGQRVKKVYWQMMEVKDHAFKLSRVESEPTTGCFYIGRG